MILAINTHKNISFKAGITKLSSDFDGTYMPIEYNHDAICRDLPPINKDKFQNNFDNFKQFANILKGNGKESKFEFAITTGRNRPEFNYYMEKIREKGLSILLPDRVIINNGCDEYLQRKDIGDFFQSKESEAFLKADVNNEKRSWIKTITSGWDGTKIRAQIKELANNKKLDVFEVDTTNLYYKQGMSLQDTLKAFNPVPQNFIAIRDDGDLGFHIALSKGIDGEELKNSLSQKTEVNAKLNKNDKYTKGVSYESLDSLDILPIMPDGQKLDKMHGIKKQVEDIIAAKSNDLIITAGDGSNDFKMLNLFSYINSKQDFTNAEKLKKIYDLPIISILVDNPGEKIKNSFDIKAEDIDNYFNSDGNVRFICVEKTNPKKPQTLQEAMMVAVKEYAKRNEEFRKNLSPEMKKTISDMTYEYPINREISKQLEEKTGTKLWNPSSALIKDISASTSKNKTIMPILFAATGVALLAGGAYKYSKSNDKDLIQKTI